MHVCTCARRMGQPHSCLRKLMDHQREHWSTQILWPGILPRESAEQPHFSPGARLASCVIYLVSLNKWLGASAGWLYVFIDTHCDMTWLQNNHATQLSFLLLLMETVVLRRGSKMSYCIAQAGPRTPIFLPNFSSSEAVHT